MELIYTYIILSILLLWIFLLLYNAPFTVREGATFEPYDDNGNPMALAQQNAANIQILYDKILKIDELSKKIDTMEDDVNKNTESINSFAEAQQGVADQLQETQNQFT